MKLINKILYIDCTQYIYENNISKTTWNDGEIWWYKDHSLHRDNGSAIKNKLFINHNKYKRAFYLNGYHLYTKEFTKQTNHIICNSCEDFCNQECFYL